MVGRLFCTHIISPIFQSTKGRYFINFCSWNKVPEPKTPEDAIPVIGTPILQDKDENGMKLNVVLLTIIFMMIICLLLF